MGENPTVEELNEIQAALDALRPFSSPVGNVAWIPVARIRPNDYNPNSVPPPELSLLYISIARDGFTQPVVVVREGEDFVIVDGFHRYSVMLLHDDIREAHRGHLPCVVLEKSAAERRAATVRHNRARGKHSVSGMAGIVFQMLSEGCTDVEVCNELGLDAEELVRLKHVTGFAKLFENVEYAKSWEVKRQIKLRVDAERKGIRTVKLR